MGTLVLEISAEVQLGQISGVLSEFWAARVMQVQVAVAGHQGPTLLPLSFGGAHPVDSVVAGRGGFATLALDGEACQLAYALVSAPTHYEKSLYYPDCKGFEGMLDVDLLDPVVSIAASDTTSWQEIVAAQRRILGASRLPALVLGLAPDWRRATEPGGWIHKGERPVYYAVQADGVVRANGYPIDGQWHERSFLCEGPKVLSFKPLAEAYELVLHPAGGVMAGREQRCDDGRSGVTAYK